MTAHTPDPDRTPLLWGYIAVASAVGLALIVGLAIGLNTHPGA